MSISVGAASNALSYLQSLLAQGTAGAGTATDPLSYLLGNSSGAPDAATAAPAANGASASASFDPGTLAALLSLQDQSANGAQGASSLFSQLDANGDGQISQTEWDTALGNAGIDQSSANALFAKLDTNGDGTISQSELSQARHGGGHHHHTHAAGGSSGSGSSGAGGADALLSGSDAAGTTTQTLTNADGSTTTIVSYADGSTVQTTTPATAANDSGSSGTGTDNSNSANLIERLIQMQAQLINQASSTLSAIA